MISTYILTGLIGVIYPVYFLLNHKKIHGNLKRDGKFKLVEYKQTIIILWVVTILILVNFFANQPPRFSLYPNFSLLGIILTILVLVLAIIQYMQFKITPDTFESFKNKLKDVHHYLPKTKNEFDWFIILSISAGICEEIIFRLFLFEFFMENTTLAIAFVLTNIIFAATHIGSGKQNVISTFFLGLIFSAIYYFTGNIWIAVLLHMVIDINSGVLGYRVYRFEQST